MHLHRGRHRHHLQLPRDPSHRQCVFVQPVAVRPSHLAAVHGVGLPCQPFVHTPAILEHTHARSCSLSPDRIGCYRRRPKVIPLSPSSHDLSHDVHTVHARLLVHYYQVSVSFSDARSCPRREGHILVHDSTHSSHLCETHIEFLRMP